MKTKAIVGQSNVAIIGFALALQIIIVVASLWLLSIFGSNFRYTLRVYGWFSALFLPGLLILPASLSLWGAVLAMVRSRQDQGASSGMSSQIFKWVGLLLSVALSFGVVLVFVIWLAGARH